MVKDPIKDLNPIKGVVVNHGFAIALALLLAGFALASPGPYLFDVAIRMLISAVIVLGLNLLFGYAGQISLGHAAFLGLGAYASAILTTQLGWPPLAALVAGAAGTAAVAFALARPVLSLKGHHLAMATLGIGIIITIVIGNERRWTGGSDGLVVPPFTVGGLTLAGDRAWFSVFAVLLVLAVVAAGNLMRSPAGRALKAIHGSETAARVAGIDVTAFKVKVFVLSAVMASLMGSLEAHYLEFLTPDNAGFGRSVLLLAMVVVGGMASIGGSIVGAALLTALPQLLVAVEDWETAVFGLILVLTMILLPDGIVPTLAQQLKRVRP